MDPSNDKDIRDLLSHALPAREVERDWPDVLRRQDGRHAVFRRRRRLSARAAGSALAVATLVAVVGVLIIQAPDVNTERLPSTSPAGEASSSPIPSSPQGASTGCPALPSSADLGVSSVFALDQSVLPPGGRIRGQLTLTNVGTEPMSISISNPESTFVTLPETDIVVAHGFDWIVGGVGSAGVLAPGEARKVTVAGDTRSCSDDARPPLTPGAYEVLVAIPIDLAQPERGYVRSNRVSIRIG